MKLHIAFDLLDLDQALAIASETEHYADIFEVGSLLIFKHGVSAIKKFKERFPQKPIFADAKIIDRSKDTVTLLAESGADWISVMAGTEKNVIHTACSISHQLGKKIMLDLLDASSLGQSALEAKSLGADALFFHRSSEEDSQLLFADRWEMVKGNTTLPIFISAQVTRENIAELVSIGAAGLVIGNAITKAANPKEEAAYFASIMGK